jgi:hypothetical protein
VRFFRTWHTHRLVEPCRLGQHLAALLALVAFGAEELTQIRGRIRDVLTILHLKSDGQSFPERRLGALQVATGPGNAGKVEEIRSLALAALHLALDGERLQEIMLGLL